MVCCVFISFLVAGLIWPIRAIMSKIRPAKKSPLTWCLADTPAGTETVSPRFSLTSRLKSFSFAISGLGFVIRNEHNARIHIAAAIFIIALGLIFQIKHQDWIILILAITSVWFAETINTAFEYVCDVVSPEKNEAVKHAKDIAAGAVLITAIGAVIIGGFVMSPYFIDAAQFREPHLSLSEIFANSLCISK